MALSTNTAFGIKMRFIHVFVRWMARYVLGAGIFILLIPIYAPCQQSMGEVVIVSLSDPVYPKLARAARVTGDVELELAIRRDGSVAASTLVKGHPLLNDAAIASVQLSRFECRNCINEVTHYSLIYTFQIVQSPDWPCPEKIEQRVSTSQNHVTIKVDPAAMHIQFSYIKVRSVKCLFLWECDSRWAGEDYYYDRVPSLKCLNMWNCGLRLREPWATCKRLHREIAR
jgi:hypothetical protein